MPCFIERYHLFEAPAEIQNPGDSDPMQGKTLTETVGSFPDEEGYQNSSMEPDPNAIIEWLFEKKPPDRGPDLKNFQVIPLCFTFSLIQHAQECYSTDNP